MSNAVYTSSPAINFDLDLPQPSAVLTSCGRIMGYGWAFADAAVAAATVSVGGSVVCIAETNLVRDDVAAAYPTSLNARRSGIRFDEALPEIPAGPAELVFEVRFSDGEVARRSIPVMVAASAVDPSAPRPDSVKEEPSPATAVGPDPDADAPVRFRDRRDLIESGEIFRLFDSSYYAHQAVEENADLEHYLSIGWKKGLNPHPLFDTEFYLDHLQSTVTTDPLTHFFRTGRYENALIHPLFDNNLYLKHRIDVLRSGMHPALHYLEYGWTETTSFPCAAFLEDYYEGNCPGVRAAGVAPALHYLSIGFREGLRPHPDFDPRLFSRLARLTPGQEPLTTLMRKFGSQSRGEPVAASPRVSIIVLNYQKPLLTLQCVYHVQRYTDCKDIEILIVDNGSSPENFGLLCRLVSGCQIIRIGVNRGFGEANNIGVEAARGEVLVFLNNDAFVTSGWLSRLEAVLRSDESIGAVGPQFLYPDGTLQEAGAFVSPDGSVVQRGKYLDSANPLFNKEGDVDYCSSATIMTWRNLFIQAGGYDLCWDPAYYEDADLSLKYRLRGKRTVYVPTVKIFHVENGTSSDPGLDLQLHNVVRANRLKFVSRWGNYLAGEQTSVATEFSRDFPEALPPLRRQTLALYTPYPLTPGGGERYLLSLAAACSDVLNCVLITEERYSHLRLLTLGRDLNLNTTHIRLMTWDEFHQEEPFDIFVSMGNQVLPPVHARGRKNFYHCQFPFPMEDGHYVRDWGKMGRYDGYIVNSLFTAGHVERQSAACHLSLPAIHVLYPAVPQIRNTEAEDASRLLRILHVGRFAPGGHCKRQDVMIDVFGEMVKTEKQPIELHLVGSLGSSSLDREYLLLLQEKARGLPVHFHVNITSQQLTHIYITCGIYWHITGITSDITIQPERFEHFGITIVEAMSAGLVPVVLRGGGPKEIITDRVDGFLIENERELALTTRDIWAMNAGHLSALVDRARDRARSFEFDVFKSAFLNILERANEEPAGVADSKIVTTLAAP